MSGETLGFLRQPNLRGLGGAAAAMQNAWAQTATRVAIEAARQRRTDGEITNYSGLLMAAVPGLSQLDSDWSFVATTASKMDEHRSTVSAGLALLEAGLRDDVNATHWASFAIATMAPESGIGNYYRADGLQWSAVARDVLFHTMGAVAVAGRYGIDAGANFLGQGLAGTLTGALQEKAFYDEYRAALAGAEPGAPSHSAPMAGYDSGASAGAPRDGLQAPERRMMDEAQFDIAQMVQDGRLGPALEVRLAEDPDLLRAFAEFHFMTRAGMIEPNEYFNFVGQMDLAASSGDLLSQIQGEIALYEDLHHAIRQFELLEKFSGGDAGLVSVGSGRDALMIPVTPQDGRSLDEEMAFRRAQFGERGGEEISHTGIMRAFNTFDGQRAPDGEGLLWLETFALTDEGARTMAAINRDIDLDIARGLREADGRATREGLAVQETYFRPEDLLFTSFPEDVPIRPLFSISGRDVYSGAEASGHHVSLPDRFLPAFPVGGYEVFPMGIVYHEFGHTRFSPNVQYDPYNYRATVTHEALGIGSAQREMGTIVDPLENPFREFFNVPRRGSYTHFDGSRAFSQYRVAPLFP